MVVLDDADPATVAAAIKVGGYFNSGQDCTASSRILVSDEVYDDVMSETVSAVESLTVGDPADADDIEMGPVISAAQQERVLGFLERAVHAKATVVTGGGTVGERGFFVQPTIVSDVTQDAEIVQREVFGPVVTCSRTPDERRRDGERRPLRARRIGFFGTSVGMVAAKLTSERW
jgi:betaine-aldehyde dehydrogenase/aminobutyraldehyde dehydrogenase